jgi:hypothetical protein
MNGAAKFVPTIQNGFPRAAISTMSGMAGRPDAAYHNLSNWFLSTSAANGGYGGGSFGVNLGPNTMCHRRGGIEYWGRNPESPEIHLRSGDLTGVFDDMHATAAQVPGGGRRSVQRVAARRRVRHPIHAALLLELRCAGDGPAGGHGESKRLVFESPWSHFTSECQRC